MAFHSTPSSPPAHCDPRELPFYTLSHGIYNDIYRHFGCLVIFEQPLSPSQQQALHKGIPWPLRERICSPSLLYLGSEDWVDADLRLAYHPESAAELAALGYTLDDFAGPERYNILVQLSEIEATPDHKKAFALDLERWLLHTHEAHPLLLFYATDPLPIPRFQLQHACMCDFMDRILPRLQQIWQRSEFDGIPHQQALISIFENACSALLSRYLATHPEENPQHHQQLRLFLEGILDLSPNRPHQRWLAQLYLQLNTARSLLHLSPPPLTSA